MRGPQPSKSDDCNRKWLDDQLDALFPFRDLAEGAKEAVGVIIFLD